MASRHNNWRIRINNIKWYHEDGYLWYVDISDGMSTYIYSSAMFIYFYYIYLLTKKDIMNINIIGMLTLSHCIDMKW